MDTRFDGQPADVTVTYTNYRGETTTRKIQPSRLFWGSTEWHPEPQWLLEAWDFGKSAVRVFALKDMRLL